MFGHNIQRLLYLLKTLADINVIFFHEYHRNKKQFCFSLSFFGKADIQEKMQKSIEVFHQYFDL